MGLLDVLSSLSYGSKLTNLLHAVYHDRQGRLHVLGFWIDNRGRLRHDPTQRIAWRSDAATGAELERVLKAKGIDLHDKRTNDTQHSGTARGSVARWGKYVAERYVKGGGVPQSRRGKR